VESRIRGNRRSHAGTGERHRRLPAAEHRTGCEEHYGHHSDGGNGRGQSSAIGSQRGLQHYGHRHGRRRSIGFLRDANPNAASGSRQQLQIAWQAEDTDGDRMVYNLSFRGEGEREWKMLKANTHETTFAWMVTRWPTANIFSR